jgi:hypothetical protein
MKTNIYGILIVLLCAFIISCNPQKRIIMRNASSDDAEIIWKINEDSVNVSRLYISNSPEVKFYLKSRNQNFKLSVPDEIKKYLLENRKGIGKTKIRITITN